jgi:hypothetical protein
VVRGENFCRIAADRKDTIFVATLANDSGFIAELPAREQNFFGLMTASRTVIHLKVNGSHFLALLPVDANFSYNPNQHNRGYMLAHTELQHRVYDCYDFSKQTGKIPKRFEKAARS